jgi:hypothetical protein
MQPQLMQPQVTKSPSTVPIRYVVWWLLIAFLLGTQWRVLLAYLASR